MKSIIVRTLVVCSFMMLLVVARSLEIQVGGTGVEGDILTPNTFIDDVGNKIILDFPVDKIISLSPTHTENLYAIGGQAKLVGVDVSSVYPYETQDLKRYDMKTLGGLEGVISAKPDVVLIEPSLNDLRPSLVSALESADLCVISLMPETLEGFGWYIKKLGLISSCENQAQTTLDAFEARLKALEASRPVTPWKGAFVESSEKGYLTPGESTLPAMALQLAGVKQIKEDLPWYMDQGQPQPTKVSFLKDKDEGIDVFFSLQGDGYGGGDLPALKQSAIGGLTAIKSGQTYTLKSPLIGRFTFRYLEGIEEVRRLVYGDDKEISSVYRDESPLTRQAFATLLYEELTLPTFVIYRSDYYDHEKYHHTYGSYRDVDWQDLDFSIIETVTMRSYLLPYDQEGQAYFDREALVTEAMLEHYLYIRKDLKGDALKLKLLNEEGLDLQAIKTIGDGRKLLEVTEQWP